MELTDWIVKLAVALIALAFFCKRAPANWSLENRARRMTGKRLLAQAIVALWAALLVLQHGLSALANDATQRHMPGTTLTGAALLVIAGGYWSIRGRSLLKPRRLFRTHWGRA